MEPLNIVKNTSEKNKQFTDILNKDNELSNIIKKYIDYEKNNIILLLDKLKICQNDLLTVPNGQQQDPNLLFALYYLSQPYRIFINTDLNNNTRLHLLFKERETTNHIFIEDETHEKYVNSELMAQLMEENIDDVVNGNVSIIDEKIDKHIHTLDKIKDTMEKYMGKILTNNSILSFLDNFDVEQNIEYIINKEKYNSDSKKDYFNKDIFLNMIKYYYYKFKKLFINTNIAYSFIKKKNAGNGDITLYKYYFFKEELSKKMPKPYIHWNNMEKIVALQRIDGELLPAANIQLERNYLVRVFTNQNQVSLKKINQIYSDPNIKRIPFDEINYYDLNIEESENPQTP